MPELLKDLETPTTWTQEMSLVCLKLNIKTPSSLLVFAARTRQEISLHWRDFNWAWKEKKKTLSKGDKITVLGEIIVILQQMHKFQAFI